jgi:hypothetical protein
LLQLSAGEDSVASILPVGPGGQAAISGADEAAVRSAIFAASSLYPGASYAEPLPGSGTANQLIQRADGSVWIWRSSYTYEQPARTGWFLKDIAGGSVPLLQQIAARNSLAYNAPALFPTFLDAGSIRRMVNCPSAEVYPDARWGNYSVKLSTATEIALWDELVALSAGITYGFTIAHKQLLAAPNRTWRLCIACYDGDRALIVGPDWFVRPGTTSTLAAAYSGGTSLLINTPATQWLSGFFEYACVYSYKLSSNDLTMPGPSTFAAQGYYYPYSKLNRQIAAVTNNGNGTTTITLNAEISANAANPYPWPIGTEVSNNWSGASGMAYPVIAGAYAGNAWGVYSPSYTGGPTTSGLFAVGGVTNASVEKAFGATAFIRFGMIGNIGSGAFGAGSLFQIDLNRASILGS